LPDFVRRAFLRVLLWFLVTGAAVGSYAFWTRDTTQLTSRVVSEMPNVSPERLWATGERTFAGYSVRSGQITIWQITASDQKATTALRSVDASDAIPSSVTVSRDGRRAFWIAKDQLVSYDLDKESSRSVAIPNLEANSLLQISDRDVGILVSPSGAIRLFRAASLAPIVEGILPIRNADMTETSGPFIAIAERATGSVVVVDTRISSKVGLTETRRLSTSVAALAITGAGTLAVATGSGSILAGKPLGTPGLVRSFQYYDDRSFLVAGDFGGVHLLSIDVEAKRISDAEPGARFIATNGDYFLLAYPGRLQLHALHYVTVMQPKVGNILRVWLGMSGVFTVFAFFRVFDRFFRWLHNRFVRGSAGRKTKPSKTGRLSHIPEVGQPAADLLQSAAERECVVFVGEELSRASGMPTWRTFVLGLIDRLYDALLLPAHHADAARAAHRRGECDEVARQLAPLALANRALLNEFALGMYRKAAALTQLHEAIAKVGACGFVTPNLDGLLERCFHVADAQTFSPADAGDALSCLLRQQFVGMKLRGLLDRPETLHVWPSEAHEANANNALFARFLGTMLTQRSMVFVGATIDEIDAWLSPADLPSRPSRAHYALIEKSDAHTVKRAQALSARYNIQCRMYAADSPGAAIEFLSQLTARKEPVQVADAELTSPSKT
jgi:hypothetical protein